MGINTIGAVPSKIASDLKLENPSSFTGHAFRRTSETLLADRRADFLAIRRHGEWRFSQVTEGYMKNYLQNEINIAEKILHFENEAVIKSDDNSTVVPSASAEINSTSTLT